MTTLYSSYEITNLLVDQIDDCGIMSALQVKYHMIHQGCPVTEIVCRKNPRKFVAVLILIYLAIKGNDYELVEAPGASLS